MIIFLEQDFWGVRSNLKLSTSINVLERIREMPSEHTSMIQQRIYDFIVNYIREEGMPPTNRENGTAMNIASLNHVDYHLTMLEKKKLIEFEARKSRGIRLKHPVWGIRVLGSISTGEPLEVFTDADGEVLDVGRELEQQGAYALVVKGQGMIGDYICDKDYVIVKPQATFESGDIVVAVHLQGHGFATLTSIYLDKEHDRVCLQPSNSLIDPTFIPKSVWNEEWQVQGKVLAIIRKSVATKSERISAVLAALKAGAVISTVEKDGNDQSVGKEAVDKLTLLIKTKLGDDTANESLVDNYLQQPQSWEKPLVEKLEQAEVYQDKAVIEAVENVTSQVGTRDTVVFDRIINATDNTQGQLDQIVEQCRKEAKQWFLYSLLAAIIGFLVILGGVVLAILTLNVGLGFLTALGSIVPDVASLLFFQQRNKTNERLDNFYKELLNIARIYKATELTLTASNEFQKSYKELIVKKWLNI